MTNYTFPKFFLPSKQFSWILLAVFFTFDAFSSYYAIRYMGAKEGNPLIAPYVQNNPMLFFPIMVFGYILTYIIYFILKTIFWNLLKHLKFVTKILIEKIVLGAIIIFYFFTVVLNNSLYILGFWIPATLTVNLTIGLIMAPIYGLIILYISSKNEIQS